MSLRPFETGQGWSEPRSSMAPRASWSSQARSAGPRSSVLGPLRSARSGVLQASSGKATLGQETFRPGQGQALSGRAGGNGAPPQATGKWGPRYVTWVELIDPKSGRTFWHFNTHWHLALQWQLGLTGSAGFFWIVWQLRCVHNGNGRVCNEEVRYGGAKHMLDVCPSAVATLVALNCKTRSKLWLRSSRRRPRALSASRTVYRVLRA